MTKRLASLCPSGQYEPLGVSAARHEQGDPRKWLWQDGEGPLCSKEERKATAGARDVSRLPPPPPPPPFSPYWLNSPLLQSTSPPPCPPRPFNR